MKKFLDKVNDKSLSLSVKIASQLSPSRLKKGDTVVMVLAAALGTIILIGFYVIAKGGLGTWGDSFTKLVQI